MGGAVPPAIVPTAGTAPAATTAAPATPTAEATVQSLPARLQDVTRPMVLTGTVTGTTPEGLTSVRTAAGQVLLQTPTPLPVDKPVTLQITPAQVLSQGAAAQDPAAQAPVNQAARALVFLQSTGSTTAQTSAAAATTTPGAVPAAQTGTAAGSPAVILANPAASVSQSATAALPLLMPGAIVPALVLAAAPKPPAAPGAAQPGAAPAATASASGDSSSASGEVSSDSPAADAPDSGTARPAAGSAGPSLTTRPTLDHPVELGGDAAHRGAETPTLKPPKDDGAPSGGNSGAANPGGGNPGGEDPHAANQAATLAPRATDPGAKPPATQAPATQAPATPPAATSAAPRPPAPPDLPQGGTVALKILTVTLPPNQSATPPPTPDPSLSNQGGGGKGSGAAPQAAPSSPSDAGLDPTAEAPDAPVLRGTIAGTTPQGRPILATPQGMLALNAPVRLPPGTQVTAALTAPPQPPQIDAAALQDLTGPVSERDWPAMRQLLAALPGLERAAAQSLLATVVPQPNRKLSAALTFLLSAIRGGDAGGWLGNDAASALEKGGHGDLLSRLDRDFQELRRQSADPLPGDWQPYLLPMFDGQGLSPIRLYIHPLKGEEGDGAKRGPKEKGSRFLLDVDLSRLGPIQLDGLVQPNRFDLILRSHTTLDPLFRLDLIQIFADSIRAVGYTGGLSFQSGAKNWVKLTRAGGGAQNYTA